MLDAVLVEHFHAAHRQRRSGLLTAGGDDAEVRFLFEGGNPIAVEFGRDKEHLLADTLLEYHRITPQLHGILVSGNITGQGKVAEMVLRHQAATEDEINRTTQSMVEDALCRAFSGNSTAVSFTEGVGPEQLDFARRTFRLRIDAEVLLRTARNRIDEIQAAYQEDRDWSAVYMFAESSGSGVLSEYEKQVLDYVDGRRTVTDIAIVCRDSCLNMGRALRSLAAKGIIRRIDQSASALKRDPSRANPVLPETKVPTAVGPTAAGTQQPPAVLNDFTPIHLDPPQQASGLTVMRVALLAALVVVASVAWLVIDYRKQQAAIAEVANQIDALVERKAWSEVEAMVQQARDRAGKDVSAQRQVEGMRKRYQDALAIEVEAVRGLIVKLQGDEARQRIAKLPSEPSRELNARLIEAETALANKIAARAALVGDALRTDDVRRALDHIRAVAESGPEAQAGIRVLSDWQRDRLAVAGSPTAPLAERRALLSLVQASRLATQSDVEMVRIEADINRRQAELGAAITRWNDRSNAGETEQVADEIRGMQLATLLAGDPLLDQAQAVLSRIATMQAEVTALRSEAVAILSDTEAYARLPALRAKVDKLAAQPGNSPVERLAREVLDVLAALEGVATSGPARAQADAINAIAVPPRPAELIAALQARAAMVSDQETIARRFLDEALARRRDGDLSGAQRLLDSMLKRPDLRGTAAARQADEELVAVQAQIVERTARQGELDTAIRTGDIEGAWVIARSLGLRQLPLAIESVPSGATVIRDGVAIGQTPLILDLPNADRVDFTCEVLHEGYQPRQLTGASAEAGWRLVAQLERKPLTEVRIPAELTSHPTVLQDKLVVVNRHGLYEVSAAGLSESRPFGNLGLDNPIYAPAQADGATILIPTRDLIAMAVTGSEVVRRPLAVRTDLPLVVYRSELVVDSTVLIAASPEGLVAATSSSGAMPWQHPGARLATAPLLAGDTILVARNDGTLSAITADDGRMAATAALSAPLLAAWTEGQGLAGLTANESWRWDGQTLERSPLKQTLLAGGHDVQVTVLRRVLVRSGTDWVDVGRLEGELIGSPFAWQGHAVLHQDRQVSVLGPRGFTVRAVGQLLAPIAMGEQLAVVEESGLVRFYGK
jgi:hypothetical protein